MGQELRQRTYITQKAFSTIRHIELVKKKEFVAVILDLRYKTFVVHIALFIYFAGIYLSHRFQIVGLIIKKTLTKVFNKYANLIDLFFSDLISEHSKHTKINNHITKLVDGQQLSYRSIYNLQLIEGKVRNSKSLY